MCAGCPSQNTVLELLPHEDHVTGCRRGDRERRGTTRHHGPTGERERERKKEGAKRGVEKEREREGGRYIIGREREREQRAESRERRAESGERRARRTRSYVMSKMCCSFLREDAQVQNSDMPNGDKRTRYLFKFGHTPVSYEKKLCGKSLFEKCRNFPSNIKCMLGSTLLLCELGVRILLGKC